MLLHNTWIIASSSLKRILLFDLIASLKKWTSYSSVGSNKPKTVLRNIPLNSSFNLWSKLYIFDFTAVKYLIFIFRHEGTDNQSLRHKLL